MRSKTLRYSVFVGFTILTLIFNANAQELIEVELGALEGELKTIERTITWENNSDRDLKIKFWSSNELLEAKPEDKGVSKGGTITIPVRLSLPERVGDHEYELRLLDDQNDLLVGYLFKFKKLAAESDILKAYKNGFWPFRAKENVFNLRQGFIGDDLERSFDVFNFSGQELNLDDLKTNLPVELSFEPSEIPHNAFAKMSISLRTDSLSSGFKKERLNLYAKDKLIGSFPIQYTLINKPDTAAIDAPKISFSRLSHDFKVISVGEVVETTFNLRNSGGDELNIEAIESNCDCLTYDLPKKTLAIGEVIELKATFNARGRIGLERKTLAIFTNDPAKPTQVLTIRAHVK